MPGKRPNRIVSVENGTAVVDVSTPKHPHVVTLIDEADLPLITQSPRRWSVHLGPSGLYVKRYLGSGKSLKMELLHRVILGLSGGDVKGDHVKHDTLDNRREKLRNATSTQNRRNSRSQAGSSSHFLGVSYSKRDRRWLAHIRYDGITRHIGSFLAEEDAALAYDKVAAREFGEFANLNFPEKIAA